MRSEYIQIRNYGMNALDSHFQIGNTNFYELWFNNDNVVIQQVLIF